MATILTKDPIASLDGDERLYGVDDPAGTPADGTVTPEVLRTYMQANWTLTVDLAADVTGVLPVANGGTGASTASGARMALGVDAAGTDNSTDVTIAAGLDYITISGQELMLGSVDLTTDVTGTLPAANGGTGQTSLGAVDAADFGSGAATDGYVLTADGAAGAAWERTGAITTASYSSNQTLTAAQCYGSVIYVTGAATITLPAVADGMSVTVVTIGAVAVSVDPNASDLIYLDGTALDDGDKITNTSTAGDIAVLTYYSADGWHASTNGWTDGGA